MYYACDKMTSNISTKTVWKKDKADRNIPLSYGFIPKHAITKKGK